MLRFLRSFRLRYLGGTQFGRYLLYALGEVLLVMVGILLALQVDNWNEERKEQREELELLEALKTDLVFTRNEMDTIVGYNRKYLNEYRLIHTFLEEDRTYTPALDSAFTNLDVWATPYLSTMTYETIQNKGIDIIQNDSLKRHIVQFYSQNLKSITEDVVRWEWSFSQNTTQPIMVASIRRLLDSGLARPNDFEALKKDDRFLNFLSILITIRSDNIDYSLRLKAAAETLIEHIDEELKTRQKS
ncbi:MAG: DUF6090 family protein [Robiginitalea sp.]|jgi:hypothetical protein